jgi:hypothetical protein
MVSTASAVAVFTGGVIATVVVVHAAVDVAFRLFGW